MHINDGEEYLVCDDCRGYYKLQEGESPEEFENCRCGGSLKYYGNQKKVSAKRSNPEKLEYVNGDPLCTRCGAKNPRSSRFCFRCGTHLPVHEKGSAGLHEMESAEAREKMKGDIRSWGKGLIFIGVIQIISMGFLDQFWGVLLMVAGIVSFKVVHRVMFVVYGTIILFAGLGNLQVGGLLTAFSIFQFVIGFRQFQKFIQWRKVT
ncbi:zinc ribbon domain-containing protein [Methanobacterium aggregans]|uniref:zinc ribbon domain-containing protein n=1 Tax=Methanobacterium aggregans TaxID=1615586 RepID=UPI001AE6CE6D|nr:zinc ribbon domain-containing protein [Methanobacterium aggregans]MBP2046100.1 ribosomal protein L40E [Methanobacterium aggregans]